MWRRGQDEQEKFFSFFDLIPGMDKEQQARLHLALIYRGSESKQNAKWMGGEWIAKWERQKRGPVGAGSDGGASHQYSAAPTRKVLGRSHRLLVNCKVPAPPFSAPAPSVRLKPIAKKCTVGETHRQNVTEDASTVCKQSKQSKQQTVQGDNLNI